MQRRLNVCITIIIVTLIVCAVIVDASSSPKQPKQQQQQQQHTQPPRHEKKSVTQQTKAVLKGIKNKFKKFKRFVTGKLKAFRDTVWSKLKTNSLFSGLKTALAKREEKKLLEVYTRMCMGNGKMEADGSVSLPDNQDDASPAVCRELEQKHSEAVERLQLFDAAVLTTKHPHQMMDAGQTPPPPLSLSSKSPPPPPPPPPPQPRALAKRGRKIDDRKDSFVETANPVLMNAHWTVTTQAGGDEYYSSRRSQYTVWRKYNGASYDTARVYPNRDAITYHIVEDPDNPWPGGVDTLRVLLLVATRRWERDTCVRFKEIGKDECDKNLPTCLKIVYVQGKCTCSVGADDRGPHMQLDTKICPVPTVVHEFGHALGMQHTHQRQDRDLYVDVEIPPASNPLQFAFVKVADNPWNTATLLGFVADYTFKNLPGKAGSKAMYDYDSIMHYTQMTARMFGGDIKTKTVKGTAPLGDPANVNGMGVEHPSPQDFDIVNDIFGCQISPVNKQCAPGYKPGLKDGVSVCTAPASEGSFCIQGTDCLSNECKDNLCTAATEFTEPDEIFKKTQALIARMKGTLKKDLVGVVASDTVMQPNALHLWDSMPFHFTDRYVGPYFYEIIDVENPKRIGVIRRENANLNLICKLKQQYEHFERGDEVLLIRFTSPTTCMADREDIVDFPCTPAYIDFNSCTNSY